MNIKYRLQTLVAALVIAASAITPAWAYPGALTGRFTINASGDQVYFSQGNLQAVCTSADVDGNTQETWTWQFATNQWDYIGNAAANTSINGNGSVSAAGTVDLFGWSTAATTYGIHNSANTEDNSTYSGDFVDWGATMGTGWRTLTTNEWDYLFTGRTTGGSVGTTSQARYVKATIRTDDNGGVNGIILFPDGVNFASTEFNTLGDVNQKTTTFATKCTSTQWTALAAKGCVFLPAAGRRYGSVVAYLDERGRYWSSSPSITTEVSAYNVSFSSSDIDSQNNHRFYGYSVRLVRAVPKYTLSNIPDGWTATADGQNVTVTSNSASIPEGAAVVVKPAAADIGTIKNVRFMQGAIPSKFSVSDNSMVYFSQGNLQYMGSATTPYWKFADSQWSYLGTTTSQNSVSTNVDRDLFCWGTSGYNHGAACYQPWSTSEGYSDYDAYGDNSKHLYSQTPSTADWGYNAISNGGNTENSGWRTLTKDEWVYVFNTRTTTSGIRYAKAKVNNIQGFILLPDDWDTSYHALASTNTSDADFAANDISSADWASDFEAHGAVFLPVAGMRNSTTIIMSFGVYWSSTNCNDNNGTSYAVQFLSAAFEPASILFKYRGISVRLVKNEDIVLNWDNTEAGYVFAMPGGNQLLNVELYPVATATAPTAVTPAPVAGSDSPLFTAGSSADGTIYYAVGTDGTNAPTTGWTTTVPTAENYSGTVYIWYKVDSDATHNDLTPTCAFSLTLTVPYVPDPTPTEVNVEVPAVNGNENVEGVKMHMTVDTSAETYTEEITVIDEATGMEKTVEVTVLPVKLDHITIPAQEPDPQTADGKKEITVYIPAQVLSEDGKYLFRVTEISEGAMKSNTATAVVTTVVLPDTKEPLKMAEGALRVDNLPADDPNHRVAMVETALHQFDNYALMTALKENYEAGRVRSKAQPPHKFWTLSCGVDVLLPRSVRAYLCKAHGNSGVNIIELPGSTVTVDGEARQVVKANNGVLIACTDGTGGNIYELVARPSAERPSGMVPATHNAKSYEGNQLHPVIESAHFAPTEWFILSRNEFHELEPTDDTEVPPCKAILPRTSNSQTRRLTISIGEGDTTAIEAAELLYGGDGEGQWYDLKGRRIERPTEKGVYILNNRKVIIK